MEDLGNFSARKRVSQGFGKVPCFHTQCVSDDGGRLLDGAMSSANNPFCDQLPEVCAGNYSSNNLSVARRLEPMCLFAACVLGRVAAVDDSAAQL